MSYPVFISYARRTSREMAERLHRELGSENGLAFLDTSDIEAGGHFPRILVDAALDARVIVVFADETYFKRWYCLRELRTALAPFEALLRCSGASEQQKAATLSHLVIALPPGAPANLLDSLPALIRQLSWPSADQTAVLAQLVKTRLSSIGESIREHIGDDQAAEAIRATLLQESALPPPINLAGAAQFPLSLPVSLGEGFVGRADDMWRIHFALSTMRGEPGASASLSGALEAGGGFGKTRLALEYLHRFGGHYPGGLFWVDADVSNEALQERFHGILKALKPETPELYALREQFRQAHKDDSDGFANELRRRLAEALHALPPERPVLFVVDNVPEAPAGAQPKPLDSWCPGIGKVAVLATSRAKLLGMPGLRSLPVDTLDRNSAVALLTKDGVDRASLDEPSWNRIAEWVGDLPLALELLQQSLKAGAISPRELFDFANRQAGLAVALDSQMDAIRGQLPVGSLRGITEALHISYDKLAENTQKAARLFAFLAPDPVPLEIIDAVGAEVFGPAARAALVTRSFVTKVPVAGMVNWFGRMHRVLADFLSSCSPDPGHEALEMCNALVSVMRPDACRDPKRWRLMNACLPHAEWLFRQLGAAKSRELGEPIIDLGIRIGILFSAEGLFEHARTIEESTVTAARSSLGDEHPDTLNAMNNLASTLHDQGDLAGARQLQERVLEIFRRLLGEAHPNTLASMNNLAETLFAQGELAGARQLQERALEIQRRVLGEEHPDTTVSAWNLFLTLIQLNETAAAKRIFDDLLISLLKGAPATLDAQQREIRDRLMQSLRRE